MPPDHALGSASPSPARGAGLLFLACSLALAGALLCSFLTGYALLQDHPGHAAELLPEFWGALLVGLAVLAIQVALVFFGLIRPYRAAAIRVDTLVHALDQNSHRDSLTGALNRTAFDQLIVRELDALRRYGVGFCGVMLEVDGFRRLSELHGYEVCDRALVELAQLLRQHMRKADFLFRWRSGRFLILASGIGLSQAQLLAVKLADLVRGHTFGHGVRLGICLGAAPAQAEDSPEVFVARVKAMLAQAQGQEGAVAASAPAG